MIVWSKVIKNLRTRCLFMSQKDFGEYISAENSQALISYWETGKHIPSAFYQIKIKAIAEEFNLTLEELSK